MVVFMAELILIIAFLLCCSTAQATPILDQSHDLPQIESQAGIGGQFDMQAAQCDLSFQYL